MKKTIKAELVSIAHKILQLRDNADYKQLADTTRKLHEKLTVLAYAEQLENAGKPTLGLRELEEVMVNEELAPASKPSPTNLETQTTTAPSPTRTPAEILADNQARYAEAKGTDDHHRPDGTQYNDDDEPVHEPVIEKIKDMWPEMTPEAADIDKVIDAIIPPQPAVGKADSFEIGNEYGQMPIFEPKEITNEEVVDDKPKNLNDRLKTGLKIGLNDKLSFIKHLFAGSTSDYNRVLSQLETFGSAVEANTFITQMVKPDYNNWEGKEVQETRFLEIVEGRYS
jgi:hypothetical protein